MEELTDDAIAGPFRVLQRRRGHRYSIDDVVTAWEAVAARPDAGRCLDLGCGLGSVLLMLAYKLPAARLTGVEAQEISYGLARQNVARNAIGDRAVLHHGDLRDAALLSGLADAPFDLVTGTPPYMPKGSGTLPPDSHRAHARMELRGGVEAYIEAAARVLAPGGRVVVCADARTPERALEGGARAGLAAVRRRDVIPRASVKGALFSVWTFARADEHDGPVTVEPPLCARDEHGGRTEAAHALRRFFDLAVNETEEPSP